MDMRTAPTIGRRGFWVVAAILLTLALLTGLLVGLATRLSTMLDGPARRLAGHVAWLAVLVLCGQVLLLFWLVVRYFREGLAPRTGTKTEYVDIWAEAGRRVRVIDDEDDEDDEDEVPPQA